MEWALGILYVIVLFIFTKFTHEGDTIALKKKVSYLYSKNDDNEDKIKECMSKIYELERTVSELQKIHSPITKEEEIEGKGYIDSFSHPQRPYWPICLCNEEKITGYRLDVFVSLNIINILSDFCEEFKSIKYDNILEHIHIKNKEFDIKENPLKDCRCFWYSDIYNNISNQHIVYNNKNVICKYIVFISDIFNEKLAKHILKNDNRFTLPPNTLQFNTYGYLTTNINQEMDYEGYKYKEILHIPIYDIVEFMKNNMNNHRDISVFPEKTKKTLDQYGFHYSYEGENRSAHVFKNKYMELTLELDFNTAYGH